jgi:CubicO group peptidase (beta-lactamase class C family)
MKKASNQSTSRRAFLLSSLGLPLTPQLLSAFKEGAFDKAVKVLSQASQSGRIHSASLVVQQNGDSINENFGKADSRDAIFLLASISKPISSAAFMTLYDQEKLRLNDRVSKFIPEFKRDGRENITLRQLLTHTSGLPDQLPENAQLRTQHAPLSEFIERAIQTPLRFAPGSRYSYASMGILLASEIAQRITNKRFADFVDETIYKPLAMKHSAMGIGELDWKATQRCQVEQAAPESGAGDPSTKNWDWNSHYWRHLGAPWGGAHGSASDVARFLQEFLHPKGLTVRPETAKLMTRNHNPKGFRARGLGFDVSPNIGPNKSQSAFGHTGSTGTLCWADPKSNTICVVLTTLPARAVSPHPRDITSRLIADGI